MYLDDVLVLGRTFSRYLSNLREVFSRLHRAGLKLKLSKCKLGHKKVVYLGYAVSAQGIYTETSKSRSFELATVLLGPDIVLQAVRSMFLIDY